MVTLSSIHLSLPSSPFTPALTAGEPALVVPDHLPIPAEIYTKLLDVRVPLTIAAVYAVTVHLLNHYSTGAPYAIAKTRVFKLLVILHNVFLAVYSAWTFVGMVQGLHNALDKSSLVGAASSLCKIRQQTRVVLGFNATSAATIAEQEAGFMPDKGLWEDALAWYGFWFYLSKFYEVVDTAIILLKGKKSSLLQTYHHAGAMICMWAGIRYMAPPIWIFCIFNSLIHALMYTYYTLSAIHIRVPKLLKQTLTTMQITQFIVGGSFAALHLFVYLDKNTPCLSNDGEVFATITNCIYLTPLTYLFVDFFIRSYTSKGAAKAKKQH
ncbi:ELO family [Sphaerosporella brunnea]|uniref:Elongation of fatty acids protein n=1 Tax=Sphaerosporella brunnea TaxID=1250544 RepID=A0A5J5F5I5_9PEZI|nr:ELO family [Sphaerosporella brunnea]